MMITTNTLIPSVVVTGIKENEVCWCVDEAGLRGEFDLNEYKTPPPPLLQAASNHRCPPHENFIIKVSLKHLQRCLAHA